MNPNRKWFIACLIPILAVLYLGSGIFPVAQDEAGIVVRLGRYSRTVGSGLNYRLPWPFEEVYRVKTSAIYPMSVGYKIREREQGIPPLESEMQWLTGDTNLINIRMEIQYRIKEPVQFLFQTEEPHFLVRRAAEAVLTEMAGQTPVDELLTRGKAALAFGASDRVQQMLDAYQSGLQVVSVNVEALEPPASVISYFQEVKSADQEREKAIVEAEGYRANRIFEARGEADKIEKEAMATEEARVAQAKGDTSRFLDLLKEYRSNPGAVRDKMYYETLAKILPNIEITVLPDSPGAPPQIQIIQQK